MLLPREKRRRCHGIYVFCGSYISGGEYAGTGDVAGDEAFVPRGVTCDVYITR